MHTKHKTQEPAGLEAALHDLGDAPASALAFVAAAARDAGAVAAAVALQRRACAAATAAAAAAAAASGTVAACPAPGPWLALAHLLELSHDYGAVADTARAWCKMAAAAGEAAAARFAGLPLAAAAAILAVLPPLPPSRLLSDDWLRAGEPAAAAGADALAEGLQQRLALGGDGDSGDGRNDSAAPTAAAAAAADRLDALALLMTAAKALFAGGALRPAAALCRALRPAAAAADVSGAAPPPPPPLHETPIRNEAAYFGAVAALLLDRPPPAPPPPPMRDGDGDGGAGGSGGGGTLDAEHPPLFVIGDSHCLAPAWRRACIDGGRARLLRPLLVTGLKAWHLRPGCAFYPRAQFEAAAALLPAGADVIVVLGEIDCREGLPAALEAAKVCVWGGRGGRGAEALRGGARGRGLH